MLPEMSTASKISRPFVGMDTGAPIQTGRAMASNALNQQRLSTISSRRRCQDEVFMDALSSNATLASSGARKA